MHHTSAPLVRLDRPTAPEFREHLRTGLPALVTGGMTEWPAFKLWDHAYLRAAKVKDDAALGVFHASGPGQPMLSLDRRMDLSELVDRLWNARPASPYPDGSLFYLKQQGMQHFPGLLRDIRRPAFYGQDFVEVNLWLGGAGCWTPLHFDYVDNLMSQVRGRRRVRFYAPEQGRALYPAFALCPPDEPLTPPHFSLVVDPRAAEPGRFPRFAGTDPAAIVDLSPGDMLYVPPYWWHHVEILEGPAVQVNFWYTLQFGLPYPSADHDAETSVTESVRTLLDNAPLQRRAGLRAILTSLCDALGDRPS